MALSIAEQLAEQKVFTKTPYVRPGNYLLKVVKGETFKTDENVQGYKVTFEVVEATAKTPSDIKLDDWTPNEVGSECAVTIKLAPGKLKDMHLKNLKALLIGLAGDEVVTADAKEFGKILDAVFVTNQAKGSLIRARTFEKTTESGNGFVGVNWSYVPPEKASA